MGRQDELVLMADVRKGQIELANPLGMQVYLRLIDQDNAPDYPTSIY
jgi:hypothetical protein